MYIYNYIYIIYIYIVVIDCHDLLGRINTLLNKQLYYKDL